MEAESASVSNARILMVGVDAGEVPALTDRLRTWGHSVCGAVPSVPAAVEQAAELDPDLALIDLDQAAGGVEAGRIASRLEVPSVYLIGCGEQDLLPPSPASFPYACVLKPLNAGQLRLNIDSVLATRARERRSRDESAQAVCALERRLADLQGRHGLAAAALENMNDGVVLTDREGKFLLLNRAALSTFDLGGLDPQRWFERFEVLQSDQTTPVAAEDFPIGRTLRGEPVRDLRVFVRDRESGHGLHLSISTEVIYNADNRPDGSVLSFRDVTAQKKAEDDLEQRDARIRQQSELMTNVFDSMSEGLTLFDADGKYLALNATGRRMVGDRPAYGLAGDDRRKGLESLVQAESLPWLHAGDLTPCAPQDLPVRRVLRGESFDSLDLCVEGPEHRLYFSISGRPLADADGRPRGGFTMFRDVTEARRRERELQELAASMQAQKQAMETVFAGISDGVVAAGKDGKFTIFNPSAERIVGLGATDTGPGEWSATYGLFKTDKVTPYPPDDVPLALALRGEPCDDVQMFTRNPHLPHGAFVSVSGRPLRDEDGGVTGGVVVFRDVTQLREAETRLRLAVEELRNQNDLSETVFENIGEGVVVINDQEDVIVFNPAAKRILGLQRRDPNAAEWNRHNFLYRADRVTPLPSDEYPLVAALRGDSTRAMDLYVPKLDIYINVHARPLWDKLGRLRGAVAVFRDSTPLMKAEQRLQQAVIDLERQNQFMETVFHSISDGVVAADRNGTLTMANRSATRLIGKALDRGGDATAAFDGTFFRDGATPVPRPEQPLSRALAGETSTNVEVFLRPEPDSEGIYVNVSGGPMWNAAGELTGGVVTLHDVTQRVHSREALLQAFAHGRTEIIDTVLHNIGNAINSVAAGVDTLVRQFADDAVLCRFTALADSVAEHEDDWIEWLSSDPRGRSVRPFFLALVSDLAQRNASLNRTARRVSDRVRHIVDIVRTQESHTTQRVQRKEIGVREAISDAVKTLQDSLTKRAIAVDVDCTRAPDEIMVQESQFHQMLVNLVKNAMEAIDALRSGGRDLLADPRIRIVVWSEDDYVALEVVDNGIGLDQASTREIFTAGYTTKQSGTGLGLHSAANFVVGSGGTIEALSEGIGRGATMRVRLRVPEGVGHRSR